MPNLVGIGNSQVPTNAMLGGLAYQDTDHFHFRSFTWGSLKNVTGNPFAEWDYKAYVVAHLPAISYLDFRLVSIQMVSFML